MSTLSIDSYNSLKLARKAGGKPGANFSVASEIAMVKKFAKANSTMLQNVALLADLPVEDLRNVSEHVSVYSYEKNEQIFHKDDTDTGVYFVVSGEVRVSITSPNGREVAYHDKRSGSLFGELAALDGGERSSDIVALEDSVLAKISRQSFLELLDTYPALNKQIRTHLVAEVRLLTNRIYELSSLNVEKRVAAEIYRLAMKNAERFSGFIEVMPTHLELSSAVLTTREAVTRELAKLEKEGLIERNNKSLTVPSLKLLKEYFTPGERNKTNIPVNQS